MDRMVKRLQKELEFMQKNTEVFRVHLPNNDLRLWFVDFVGAKSTVYEGEPYRLQFIFSQEYVSYCLNTAHRVT